MATTRYVTGISDGVLTLTARALDPDGNIVATNIAITVAPSPVQTTQQKCYSEILLMSSPQSTLEAACAQFGVQSQYYIGNPRNTVYSTRDCSIIAQDGYYKLDNGAWVLISGGTIIQRGSCATVGVTTDTTSTTVTVIPEFTQPVLIPEPAPIATTTTEIIEQQPILLPQPTTETIPFVTPTISPAIPTAFTPITVFVPETTFTPLAPTFTPPTTTTTTFVPVPQPEPVFTPAATPAPQPIFGCTDINAINYNPNATNDDGTCQYQNQTVGSNFSFDVTNLDVI